MNSLFFFFVSCILHNVISAESSIPLIKSEDSKLFNPLGGKVVLFYVILFLSELHGMAIMPHRQEN